MYIRKVKDLLFLINTRGSENRCLLCATNYIYMSQ